MNKTIRLLTALTIFFIYQNLSAYPDDKEFDHSETIPNKIQPHSDKPPDLMVSSSCCVAVRGNVNADENDQTDIVDLVYLINYFYDEGPGTTCFEESDINRSGAVDIGDIVYLVNYMFNNGPAPFNCHSIGQD